MSLLLSVEELGVGCLLSSIFGLQLVPQRNDGFLQLFPLALELLTHGLNPFLAGSLKPLHFVPQRADSRF